MFSLSGRSKSVAHCSYVRGRPVHGYHRALYPGTSCRRAASDGCVARNVWRCRERTCLYFLTPLDVTDGEDFGTPHEERACVVCGTTRSGVLYWQISDRFRCTSSDFGRAFSIVHGSASMFSRRRTGFSGFGVAVSFQMVNLCFMVICNKQMCVNELYIFKGLTPVRLPLS